MNVELLALIALFVVAYGLISARIEGTIVTPPMLFTLFGFILGDAVLGFIDMETDREFIQIVAEVTLIILLFADASRIDLRLLRREHNTPVRLLGVGLPLTILLGAVVAMLLFPRSGIWIAAVLAAILAPTDAALGQAVMANPRIPVRIRQSLNVESGLNDGIALPFLLLFLSLAGIAGEPTQRGFWIELAARQLLLGPLVGLAVGYVGGKAVGWAVSHGWMTQTFERLSAVALALGAYALAELSFVGGNGFIAAFVAGALVGHVARDVCEELHASAETEGQIFTLLTFILFGAVLAPRAFTHGTPAILLYAILSLTVVRMVPVTLSLIGLRLQMATVAFLGWFGPRGIASIVYVLLALEDEMVVGEDMLLAAAATTILLSIFAHGVTAAPLSKAYADYMARAEEGEEAEMAEMKEVAEMPLRLKATDSAQP